jgi:hypothetical protein
MPDDLIDKDYQHESPDETPQEGATPWTNTSDYGSEDWHPSYEQMVGWVEKDNLSTGDIAMGFGLDADSGKYFPEPDFWKAGYLSDEFELDEDKYDLAIQKADRAEQEGWEAFDTAVDTGVMGADANMYEIMEGSRAREVQQGMMSGRQGRARRQTIQKFSQGLEQAQTAAERIEAGADESKLAAGIALQQGRIDLERGEEAEKRSWYDNIWDAYSGLSSRGAIENTSGGHNSSHWVTEIRGNTKHWSSEELNAYSSEPEFLQWFNQNIDDVDRDTFKSSETELAEAYDNWKAGKAVDAGTGCVVATHAVSSGAFTKKDKRIAVKWCIKYLHGTWWGEAFRRGYRDYGQKKINDGVVENYYQDFQDYVNFATGKKRTFKTFIVFIYRSIQLFLRGLRING